MWYAEQFVFRNFRLFLHCCELHVQPWLFGMQLAAVCMSAYGPVHSVCTHQPKAIWVWDTVHCEPVVAHSSRAVQTICGICAIVHDRRKASEIQRWLLVASRGGGGLAWVAPPWTWVGGLSIG